jgi:hypothetical protein
MQQPPLSCGLVCSPNSSLPGANRVSVICPVTSAFQQQQQQQQPCIHRIPQAAQALAMTTTCVRLTCSVAYMKLLWRASM